MTIAKAKLTSAAAQSIKRVSQICSSFLASIWVLGLLVPCSAPVRSAELTLLVTGPAGEPVVGAAIYLKSQIENGDSVAANEIVEILQLNKRFTPVIGVVPLAAPVVFDNQDDITHHIYTVSGEQRFALILRRGERSEPITLTSPGVLALGCNIHDWMGGYLLVADATHYGSTDSSGRWNAILAPGKYRLVVWHPQLQAELEEWLVIEADTRRVVRLPMGFDAHALQQRLNDFDFLEDY